MLQNESYTKREVIAIVSLAVILTALPWGLLMIILYYALAPFSTPL